MEFQYHSQRFRNRNGRRVGTVPVGAIVYIQDGVSPMRFPDRTVMREPWQVEAWIPRETTVRDPKTGQHSLKRCAGGHLAVARSLSDRRKTRIVADWLLLACIDRDLCRP
jgi:hypothetical protein